MATTTLTSLMQLLSEAIGDHLTFSTTTNIGAGTTVISTGLQSFDGGQDDYFNDWWVYIDGTNNAGILRQVSDYATSTGTLTVRSVNLQSESGSVTCYLHRYNRDNKKRGINRAIEQVPLYTHLDDLTLISGNILPDASFEWWTSSSASKLYTASNATLAKTTTAGLYRGQRGTTSAKVTASSNNGYMTLKSDAWPRLLDLMGRSVSGYVWASPEEADDATLVFYTKQADGTEQTLSSTTSNPAGEFARLVLENQTFNDDLVEVEIRFKVTTDTKFVYFDDCIINGMNLFEYLLPENFQAGHVSQVLVQEQGYSDQAAYDIHARHWGVQDFRIENDGTYEYLRLENAPINNRRIRLKGYKSLSTLSADTDTVETDGDRLNLIVYKAAAIFYRLEQGPVSSEDKGRFFGEISKWERDYRKLMPGLMMVRPSDRIYGG